MTTHHPSEAVLTDYASGALRPAFGAVVAAHLEGCPHCRAWVGDLEALGGALIADLPETPLDEQRLAHAMAALDRPSEPRPAPASTADRIPFGRERWLAPGMSIRKARLSKGGDLLYLLRLPAGQKTIPHGHQGAEFTTVLKGAYDDEMGRFSVGDFCEMDPDLEHQPAVAPEGECICLIASEKPMRMFTPLGRLVHAFTGV